jgi:hypothetical protein
MTVSQESTSIASLKKFYRKNISKGNRKARATGFAIPVLDRFPKIFADVY